MRPRTSIPISLVAVAACSALLAGCGGSSSTTATAGTAAGAGAPNPTLAFARCMQSHGVPNFPDPDRSGEIPKSEVIALGNSPQLNAAQSACHRLVPGGGPGGPQETVQQQHAHLVAGLAFANCMRVRGFSNFPDPTAQGELTPEMVTAAGIDLHQQAILQAGLACAPLTHGLITRAAVERAVRGG